MRSRRLLLSLLTVGLVVSLKTVAKPLDDWALESDEDEESSPGSGGADTWEIGATGDEPAKPKKEDRVEAPVRPPPKYLARSGASAPPPPETLSDLASEPSKKLAPPPPEPLAPPPPPPPRAEAPPPPPPPDEYAPDRASAPRDESPPPGYDEKTPDNADELFAQTPPQEERETVRRRDHGRGLNYYSPMHFATQLEYGNYRYDQFVFSGFGARASGNGNAAKLTFEYIPYQGYGKAAVGTGFGFFTLNNYPVGATARASLYTIPVELSGSYRLEFWRHQIFVPFVRFGVGRTFVRQRSNFGNTTEFTGVNTTGIAGGAAFNLRTFGVRDSQGLDYNYGINDTFLVFEVESVSAMGKTNGINIKHTAFRGGLRFEY